MAAIAQVNVRMDRELKERGDATLSLAGSSPVKIIRQLWECLATGGDAYERIMEALSLPRDETAADDAHQLVARSADLFLEFGSSFGLDLSTFEPDLRPTSEVLEEIEWGLLEGKGLV